MEVRHEQSLITPEIRKTVSGGPNWFVLLTVNNEISSWKYGDAGEWIWQESFKPLLDAQDIAAVEYREQQYIAVASGQRSGSKFHGSIDFFRYKFKPTKKNYKVSYF